MALTITNLRVDYRSSESPKPWPNVPYIIVNVVFKCDRSTDYHDDFGWQQAKVESEEYRQVLTIDDPKTYEDWITIHWDLNQRYSGYGRAWISNDPPWRYIEKFDCFWFREWISDCAVTRAIISELEHYKEHGKLPSVYRSIEAGIILTHLRTLQTYWD